MRFFICLRYLFLLAFVLTAGGAMATENYDIVLQRQKQRLDSCRLLLNEKSLTERRKMEIYHDIFNEYSNFNQDSALYYSYKALELAEKLNEAEWMIKEICDMGVIHCFKGKYKTALTYFTRMRELAITHGNKDQELVALSLFAYTYAKEGKYHTAIDYYLRTLKLADSYGLATKVADSLSNLSEINRRLGNAETAIQYLKQAEEKCTSFWSMAHIWNEYAYNYLDLNDLDMALHYALKADSTVYWTGSVNDCYTKGLLATVYLRYGDPDRALQYALESYRRADGMKDKNLLANAGKILSDIYLAQKRYPQAEAAALEIWETDSTYIDESRDVAKNIALANIYMGNAQKAAYYLEKYSELYALHSEKSFRMMVSDLTVKYEVEKKETRIASLEKERQLYVWLGISGGLLAIVLGIALWQNKRNVRKEKQLIVTRSILDGEMKERKRIAQDLHDRLSGNLSAVKLELNKHPGTLQDVSNQLDKCIKDVHDAAHDLMPVSLQFGMKVALEDFAAHFPNVRFHFFGEEKRINERMEFVVYCCAGELVNNAIKHSGAKNINLQLIQEENCVTLTVSDDGCGFDEKAVTKGLGLKSIRDRVASCNGRMDVVTSPGRGTETTIELKIENYRIGIIKKKLYGKK